jgi:hypothetical protein
MTSPPWRDDPNFGGPPSLTGEEPDGANRYRSRPFQAELNAHDRHVAAIAAILLAPLVIDVPMAAIMRGGLGRREPEFIFMLAMFSISVAKFCLLAIWLAWGGSRLIWRVIVVFASLLFTCFAFAYDAHATEGYSAVLLACAAIAGTSAIPKLFGVRWVSDGGRARSTDASRFAHAARQLAWLSKRPHPNAPAGNATDRWVHPRLSSGRHIAGNVGRIGAEPQRRTAMRDRLVCDDRANVAVSLNDCGWRTRGSRRCTPGDRRRDE